MTGWPPPIDSRVHEAGEYGSPGVVVAIVDERAIDEGMVIVVRYWWKHKQRYHWKAHRYIEWKIGLVCPGPIKRGGSDGREA